MSYSFNVRASDKAAAIAACRARMAEEMVRQPCHSIDAEAALGNMERVVGLLPDDPSMHVAVSMSGYVGGEWAQGELTRLTSANVMCGASLVAPV